VADQTAAPEPNEEPEPKLLPLFLLYTFGRLAIAAVLIALLWALGLPGTPGFLFGVLLAMPVSFFALGPVRTRLTAALAARNERKEALRVQLRGSDADDGVS
jgi:pilus assembly protein TadC